MRSPGPVRRHRAGEGDEPVDEDAVVIVSGVVELVLGGIDGLYYYDGCLIIIENGMVPLPDQMPREFADAVHRFVMTLPAGSAVA